MGTVSGHRERLGKVMGSLELSSFSISHRKVREPV